MPKTHTVCRELLLNSILCQSHRYIGVHEVDSNLLMPTKTLYNDSPTSKQYVYASMGQSQHSAPFVLVKVKYSAEPVLSLKLK